jgi:hypothetical protein
MEPKGNWRQVRTSHRPGLISPEITPWSSMLATGRSAFVERRRVVILGAAGRDFHDFNVLFRADASREVVAFTATQIPGIEGRVYPPSLAGPHYPRGIPIRSETDLE